MPTNSIYINNKYNIWYHNIISNAQLRDRVKGNGTYFENHHIIPKSLGGTNLPDNLVLLTAREHYICHALLCKFTFGNNRSNMIYAFHFMHSSNGIQIRYINSKLYESNKIKMGDIQSENMKGNQINNGRILSKEHKEKLKHASLNNKHTIETKLILREKNLGENNPLFKGYYHTPWGRFPSCVQASTKLISSSAIFKWCKKHPDKIITYKALAQSPYLKQLPESPLGKTFREIGFGFEIVMGL